jgi:hypothetical protein
MAVGTTFNSNLDMLALIILAYRKVKNYDPTPSQIEAAKLNLNLIMREKDPEAGSLWAITADPSTITLVANQFIYTVANDSLQNNIILLESMVYRDSSGQDTPMEIQTPRGYEQIGNKFEIGSPRKAYLTEDRDLASRQLFISPALSSVNTQSELVGTDTQNYQCIRNIVGADANKPITGANYKLFWTQAGTSGVAYVEGTQYYAPQLLRYIYRRPLWDFDLTSDNPDVPQSHVRNLLYALAKDLAIESPKGSELTPEQMLELRIESDSSSKKIRDARTYKTDNHHNKGEFF